MFLILTVFLLHTVATTADLFHHASDIVLDKEVVGNFIISWDTVNPYIKVVSSADPDRVLFQTLASWPFITVGFATESRSPIIDGNFKANEWTLYETPYQSIKYVKLVDNILTFSGEVYGLVTRASYTLKFSITPRDQLHFDVKVTPITGHMNRIFLNYWCDPEESFHGFGVQYTHWNLKGRRIPIFVAEQGIGRGLQPITSVLNIVGDGAGGDWTTTYAPKPAYITSQNRSILFENTEAMYFDLRDDDAVVAEVWGLSMSGYIFVGDSLPALIEEITAITGRMKPLPKWTQEGAVVGLEGGTKDVNHILDKLIAAEVPVKAVWLQDWVGLRHAFDGDRLVWNWVLDEQYYPKWSHMVQDWANQGIRVISYINPFFSNPTTARTTDTLFFGRNLYEEGVQNQYFVKNKNNSPYLLRSGSIEFFMVDLTNPFARDWMKSIIKDEMVRNTGVSGWMADFGEYLPFDAVLYSGADAAAQHNFYPQQWAELNKEAVEEYTIEQQSQPNSHTILGEDLVYFMRSAWTNSPGSTSLFWLGDQLVTWDNYDGIKSVLTATLSGGFGGHSLTHSDIGGYTMEEIGPVHYTRSKELLLRWIELAAFGSALFRSHIGLSTSDSNAQIYTDGETLSHFATFTRIFAKLADYRQVLMEEAYTKGYPLMRSMAMHYSYDPVSWSLTEQYMFGPDLLVAPVLNPGTVGSYTSKVKVYIPANTDWIHLWSGKEVYGGTSGKYITVTAYIGQPPVFYQPNSVVGLSLAKYIQEEAARLHKSAISPDILSISNSHPMSRHHPNDVLFSIVSVGVGMASDTEVLSEYRAANWMDYLGVTKYISNWEDHQDYVQ